MESDRRRREDSPITVSAASSSRTNRLRRQRGYSFERELVNRINSCGGWRAVRLGAPSTFLPDVMAVNNRLKILIAIEAKTTSKNSLKIPLDQVIRCLNWIDMLSLYRYRYAVLAVKFISKKWKETGEYTQRKIKEYYYSIVTDDNYEGANNHNNNNNNGIVVRYDLGVTRPLPSGFNLSEFRMPWFADK